MPNKKEELVDLKAGIEYLKSIPDFSNLSQEIKNEILESKDPYLFAIPTEKNNKYVVFLKEYGEVEVSSSTLGIIETDDIDKIRYFQKYILPFTKTLTFEFVR